MPIAIDATVGGASANSFCTLAEATTYLSGRLNTSLWDNAVADNQNRSLVEAARELNVLNYSSRKSTGTQALQWPRYFAFNPDASTFIPWYYTSTEIPQRVKDAQSELALEFLKAGSTDIAALDPTISITRKQVDVLATDYAVPWHRAKGLARFPRVWNLISPLLADSPSQVSVVRG
jgi:hypothetical protein